MTEQFRVLEIIKGLDIGGIHGGAERFGADLSIALARKGIQVEVAVFFQTFTKAEQKWLEALQEENIPVIFLANWNKHPRVVRFFVGCNTLVSSCKERHYNILHSHTQFGTFAGIYAKVLDPGIKIVRTAHNTKEWGDSIISKMQEMAGKLIFPICSDAQVAVSNGVLSNIQKYVGQRFTKREPVVIHNAIPGAKIKPRNTRDYQEFVVGTAARFSEQKGLHYLIEAASIVHQQIPQVKFLIAGDGELKEEIQKQIHQLGLQNIVILTGIYLDVYEFFSQLDLFVLPSLWEGLPTVILESMASGVPVIGTNIPGTNELIQNGVDGWLVPPKNPQALAEKIISVLRSSHLREAAVQRGYLKAEQYTMDKIADQYINLFNRVLSVENTL